jgi:hypothetical protein
MVVKADDLPKLNSLFRKAHGQNVPVLDGRSSQILLVSNKLEGRPNESWLAPILLDGPAKPARPLDAMFEDQLEVIGWEVTDEEGRPQADVVPQTKYHLRTYYRVLKPIPDRGRPSSTSTGIRGATTAIMRSSKGATR